MKQQQTNSETRKAHIDTKQDYGQDNLYPKKRRGPHYSGLYSKIRRLNPSPEEDDTLNKKQDKVLPQKREMLDDTSKV